MKMTVYGALSFLDARLVPASVFASAAIMDHDAKLSELRARLAEITDDSQAIFAKSDEEGRDIGEDEQSRLDANSAEFARVQNQIVQREAFAAQQKALEQPQARKVPPQTENTRPTQRTAAAPRSHDGRGPWRNLGDLASDVRAMSRGQPSDRMQKYMANLQSEYGNEGSGPDGGVALPPDFRNEIMRKVMGDQSLIGRTTQLQTVSNSISMPKDETTPWQSTGGIQSYWEGEASQITGSKPALGEHLIKLNKLTTLVQVSDELLDDAPAMDGYLRIMAPEKMDFRITDAIVNGTGAGQPQGLIASSCIIDQVKEGGQAADTISAANIRKMWTRMHQPCRSNAIWLANYDVQNQLLSLYEEGTAGGIQLVYMPAGGLSASPYDTLMGRPIIYTDACQTLGDRGDLILADLSQYMTATKVGGVQTDTSIHLLFDYNMTAYRFVFRIGGAPWWSAPIQPKNGSVTRSCFVALEAR